MPFESEPKEVDFVVNRLKNEPGTAEGPILPPRQKGSVRVPLVKALKLVRTQSFFGSTQFTLTFEHPTDNRFISHYVIYVLGLLGSSRVPLGTQTVSTSPAEILVTADKKTNVSLIVQTVLKSGLISELEKSPAVSGTTIEPNVSVDDLAPGTAGQLITWDAVGAPTTIGPGTADHILVGSGPGAVPQFKSRTTLDLVEGRANLANANRVVIVSSAGVATQTSYDHTTLVQGAGNLTTASRVVIVSAAGVVTETSYAHTDLVRGAGNLTDAGAVPFVSSSGILSDDPTLLFWDDSNNRLGIGTNAPDQVLDVTGNIRMSGTRTKLFYKGDNSSHDGSLGIYSPDNGTTAIITPYDDTGSSLGTSHIRFGGFGDFESNTVNFYLSGNMGIGISNASGVSIGARLEVADGANDSNKYGSLQITRAQNGHTASHISFVRNAAAAIGLGFKQSSSIFGFGQGTTGAHDPHIFSYDPTIPGVGILHSGPQASLHIFCPTLGTESFRLVTNNDPQWSVFQNRVSTTNASVTTLHTVAISSSITVALRAIVVARRTGGAAGTAGDGARYELKAVYKNIGGAATLIGAVTKIADEDQAGWDVNFTPSGANVLIEVTGAVDNNITWDLSQLDYYPGGL